MSEKSIILEIEADVTDVINTAFTYSNTAYVPNASDPNLSYERAKEKKGKILETCVLYVDIRDSVALTERHNSTTMGKIYTAFTKAVIKAGREHNGHTRNIIGDRVMIVFPKENCFVNAVRCAITINHIVIGVLNVKFAGVDFKCGIGIDYGELKVIKVGIQRNGTEGPQNKGLVWAGYPANIASRLTDMGSKTIKEEYYEVTRHPLNPKALIQSSPISFLSANSLLRPLPRPISEPVAPLYLTTVETIEMTESQFAKSFIMHDNSTLGHFNLGGKMIRFVRKQRDYTYPPILITEKVYKGLLAESPNEDYKSETRWKVQTKEIRNVKGKVYGAEIYWKLD